MGTAKLCSLWWAQPLLIQHPGDAAARCPQVTADSCWGQDDRWGLTSTWVVPAAALPLGYLLQGPRGTQGAGEPAVPLEQFSYQQHKLPEPWWTQSRDVWAG